MNQGLYPGGDLYKPSLIPSFSAHKNGVQQQNITGNFTNNLITYPYVVWDTHNFYNPVTSTFFPKDAGYYMIIGQAAMSTLADQVTAVIFILKNGTITETYNLCKQSGTSAMSCATSKIIYFDGISNYVQIFATISAATNTTDIDGSTYYTYFQAFKVG